MEHKQKIGKKNWTLGPNWTGKYTKIIPLAPTNRFAAILSLRMGGYGTYDQRPAWGATPHPPTLYGGFFLRRRSHQRNCVITGVSFLDKLKTVHMNSSNSQSK